MAKDIKSFNFVGHDSGFEFFGSTAPNTITGGAGNDRLQGGADKDVLYASGGIDTLVGKAGEDTFVLAPSGTYRANIASRTTISDFGDGTDKLNFTAFFGKTTASASATPIQVDAAPTGAQQTLLAGITANGVILINNSGTWLDSNGKLAAATAANIASVFTGVTISDATTNSKSYAAISYDISNGADLWLISNFTGLTAVTVGEIQLVGHIDSPANVDLLTYLKTSGSIVV
jgi:Ca2+-binding RTX toxin-like protein